MTRSRRRGAVLLTILLVAATFVVADRALADGLASTDIVVDAEAWFPTGSSFNALPPARVVDTRTGVGGVSRLPPGQAVPLALAGRGGVPGSGAAVVVVNLTVVAPSGPGFLTAWPSGPLPDTSNLNYSGGQTVAGLAVVPLATNGTVLVRSLQAADLIVDVQGWFPGGALNAGIPARLADSRSGVGLAGPLPAGQAVRLAVAGRAGVPSTGVGTVLLNLTVTQPAAGGYLTASPGVGLPTTSNVNYVVGQTVANLAVVPLAGDGTVALWSLQRTHVVVDVQGWFLAGQGPVPMTPVRLADSRSGFGSARLQSGQLGSLTVAGRAGLPAVALGAVVVNLTVTNPDGDGWLAAWGVGAAPGTSNVNFVARQTVATLAVVPVAADGTIRLVVDVRWRTGPAIVVTRASTSAKVVVLTFDAGSDAGNATGIVDFLTQQALPATFFVTGRFAERYAALVQLMAARGFRVGNHSYSHPSFTGLSTGRPPLAAAQMTNELDRAEAIIAPSHRQ